MKKQYKERLLPSVPEEYDTTDTNINNLVQMFPSFDKNEIEILWRTHGNFSKVVDIILREEQIKKDYEYAFSLNKNEK